MAELPSLLQSNAIWGSAISPSPLTVCAAVTRFEVDAAISAAANRLSGTLPSSNAETPHRLLREVTGSCRGIKNNGLERGLSV